jgi:glycosyltransferase involved in cell wall biosynthesis
MKRFGSIFPFLESGSQTRHIGRLVANHDFVQALLKYSTFDEFVFSNPSASNLKMFAHAVSAWGLSSERLASIRYLDFLNLPVYHQTHPFHVFHLGGWGRLMAGLHHIRAKHASNPWPITAVTHSLNGRSSVEYAARVSHARMGPCDAIFCSSTEGREAMRRLLEGGAAITGRRFEGRLEHLPLGIDDDLVDAVGDGDRARARLRIPAEACVLLVLGRITPFQKMDIGPLLRAFAGNIVPNSRRSVCLVFAGSAAVDQLTLLKKLVDQYGAGPHVRVHPNFPADQKADILAMADMLVSPVDNTQETFGLSIVEAQAAGLPVVASRFDGYRDLVDDGRDGFLVDTYSCRVDPMEEWFDLMDDDSSQLFQSQGVAVDMDQLATRVLQLVHDDGLRASMGAAGKEKARRDYRWSRVIARYEETWDRLASEAALTGVPPAGKNPYNLGPAHIFSHYASHQLLPDDYVVATAESATEGPYNETATALPPALLEDLVARAQRPIRVESLSQQSAHGSPDAALYAIVWLMKYGLLRRQGVDRATSTPTCG